MRHLALITALCCAGGASAAELTIKSGEHGQFTRLVIPMPHGAMPDIVKTERRLDVSVAPYNASYDPSEVFKRIGRGRISGVEPTASGVSILLNCACNMSYFIDSDLGLVMDISGQARMLRPVSRPSSAPQSTTAQIAPSRRAQTGLPAAGFTWYDMPAASGAPAPRPSDDGGHDVDLDEIRARILQSLSGAEAATLVDKSPGAELGSTESLSESLGQTGIGVGVHSAIGDQMARTAESISNNCPPGDFFAPNTWDTVAPYDSRHDALSQAGDSGEISDAALISLAQSYLSVGFGIEASSVLKGLGSQSREAGYLSEMARLVDAREGAAPMLSSVAECSGAASVWAVLAGVEFTDLSDEAQREAAIAYMLFPEHLRTRLNDRLLNVITQPEEATVVSGVLQRATGFQTIPEKIENSTEYGQEHGVYYGVDFSNITAPDLAAFIQQMANNDMALSPDFVTFTEAYLFELQGGEGAQAISEARLSYALTQKDFVMASDVFFNETGGENAHVSLARRYLNGVVRHAPDDRFLDDAFLFDPTRYDDGLRALVADRLAQMGFSDRASDWQSELAAPTANPAEPQMADSAPEPAAPAATAQAPRIELSDFKQQLESSKSLRERGALLLR